MKKWMSLLLALVLVLGMSSLTAAEESNPVGAMEGNVYVNDFFNFRVELPQTWRSLNDEELAQLIGAGNEYASREGLASLLSTKSAVCGLYAIAVDGTNSSIIFMIEDLRQNSYLTEQGYYDITKDMLSAQLTQAGATDVTKTQGTYMLMGQPHVGVQILGTIKDVQRQMTAIMLKADHYMGVITIGASSQEETDKVLAMCGAAIQDGFVRGLGDTWTLIGTIDGTNWKKDFPMIEAESGVWTSASLPVKAGDEFKFRANGEWTVNVGQDFLQDGKNYGAELTGDCVFTLNFNEQTVSCKQREKDIWAVVGTLYNTYWDTDFPMVEDGPGIWRSMPLELKAGDAFKVRLNGAWTENYGITDGACVQDGKDIVIDTDGVYVITLDLNTVTLSW